MAGYRPAYTVEEKKKIVQYILDNHLYYDVKGLEPWKKMVASGLFERTDWSLREHYLKTIIHELHFPMYELTGEQIHQLKDGARPNQARVRKPRPDTDDFDLGKAEWADDD